VKHVKHVLISLTTNYKMLIITDNIFNSNYFWHKFIIWSCGLCAHCTFFTQCGSVRLFVNDCTRNMTKVCEHVPL